jgi:ubiquinone/menaquinone biosynthesis C-methylase UbiE
MQQRLSFFNAPILNRFTSQIPLSLLNNMLSFVPFWTVSFRLFFTRMPSPAKLKMNICPFSYECPNLGTPMPNTSRNNEATRTAGLTLHSPIAYDLLVWFITRGHPRTLRDEMLRPARLQPGESVLDVGCGTGSLAIAAKRKVGPSGAVYGVDASPEMIERATKKARRAGTEVSFKNASAQSLPFQGATFDVVLSTVMLHHLPRPARKELAIEVRRVLRPGGRFVVIDFGASDKGKKRFLDHFHRRHGHVEFGGVLAILREAGLNVIETGELGMRGLQFVVTGVSCCA